MHEIYLEILSQLRSAWRFRWRGVALAWALAVAGWVALTLQPDIYEARARVYVDASSILRPLLKDNVLPSDVPTRLAFVREALLGRVYLERIAAENGLYESAVTELQRERVFEKLRRTVRIDATAVGDFARYDGSSMFTISYRHENRDIALGVVTTLLNSLIEDTLSSNRENADAAELFLEERIQEYESRLQKAEQALADFQREHSDRLPGTEGTYFERMQRERELLADKERLLKLAESRRAQLEQQLATQTPVAVVNDLTLREPPPNSIDARIHDLQVELDRLLLTYTERHRDVIAVRETLERLKQQRAEQLRELGVQNADQPLSTLGSSQVYQAAQIALNEVRADIAALKADVEDRKHRLAELQALIDEVPQVEAELQRLNRDYDDVRRQYQLLIQSRETQMLSRKAAEADQVEFPVLDPPTAKFEPVAPRRLLYTAAILAASLGAGGALCYLLAQFKPVFSSGRALSDALGLPMLGAVSRIVADPRSRWKQRAELMSFSLVVAGLVGVFGVIALIEIARTGGVRGLLLGV